MCDNIDHCSDGADEKDELCGSMTEGTCTRRVGNAGNISLPVAWLLDGWQDCVDGRDETDIWPTCGKGKTFRLVPSQGECENTFICPWGKPGYVELADLCDGVETCGNENAVCSTSRRSGVFQNLETTAHTSNVGLTKRFSHCFPGLQSIETKVFFVDATDPPMDAGFFSRRDPLFSKMIIAPHAAHSILTDHM